MQVGYGLASDLSAIATALGGEGASCVAVTKPAAELLLLSRRLRRDYPANIPRVRHSELKSTTAVFGIVVHID